jgi:putative phosphonate metabolism protein
VSSPRRYALYFAPAPDSVWWRFGSTWLGRDACSGETLSQPIVSGIAAAELAGLTAEPRRYGFHATLKAPFRLVPELDRAELVASLRAFCAAEQPLSMPLLRLARLEHFIALVPAGEHAWIDALAARLVRHFDHFRAAPTAAERARRTAKPLTARQLAHLDQWGYPHVFEDFRFHMSLTGDITATAATTLDRFWGQVQAEFERISEVPLPVDAVCLFEEPAPGAAFDLTERIRFED